MPKTLHALPSEIFLLIASSLTHQTRNSDLSNLSLVSHKRRAIAQETLLKAPRLHLTHIDAYIRQVHAHPLLCAQITSLEVHSASAERLPLDAHGLPQREYVPTKAPRTWTRGFVEKCKEVIKRHAADTKSAMRWGVALFFDCVPALLGVLLCMLPKLRELLLGDTWLMDLPVFSHVLCRDILAARPAGWRHGYLAGVLSSKLRVLDVPADMSSLWFSTQVNTVFDFRRFGELKELGVSMKMLWWCPMRRYRGPPDPREIFPASLEVLRISEATACTPSVVAMLCQGKRVGHFKKLRRVEVYYMECLESVLDEGIVTSQALDPVTDLQRVCKAGGVALYVHLPAHQLKTWEIGGSPWRMKEDQDAWKWGLHNLPAHSIKFPGVPGDPCIDAHEVWDEEVEEEWDCDGDVVMLH
jgi:hypothetical protein